MHDAFTLDGVEVWTVEDGGRINHRNSSGVWAYQTTPDEVQDLLRRIYFRPNGTHGWAVGENGAFIKTTNGGATWSNWSSTVVVGSGSEDLWDVHFLDDGSQGWVCGLEMIWHWTSTSGEWAQVELLDDSEPPMPVFERYEEFELYAIDIVPGATSGTILGLASAEPGLILRCTDDGDVWQVVFDITSLCPSSGPCPSTPGTGELTACACQALCGEDPAHAEMWDIEISRFPTRKLALCVGGVGTDCGIVLASEDDGLTWLAEHHECQSGTTCTGTGYYPPAVTGVLQHHKKFLELYGVSIFHGDNSAIVAGYGGQIAVRDANSGVWADRSQYGVTLNTPSGISIPMYGAATNSGTGSTGIGLITGEGGYLRDSDDGGQTWVTASPTGEPWRIRDVHFVTDKQGWMVGQFGWIARSDEPTTATAGQFWDRDDSEPALNQPFLNAIVLDGSGQVGVVVGDIHDEDMDDRMNFRFNLDCQDSVETGWAEPSSIIHSVTDELGDLLDVTWAGGLEFWAVGTKGRIYHSDAGNGPDEWRQFVPREETYTQFKDFRIEGVDFSSTTRGLFVGQRTPSSVLTGKAYQYEYDSTYNHVDFTEVSIDEDDVVILTDVTIVGDVAYAVGVQDTGSVKQGVVLGSTLSHGEFGAFTLLETFPACTVGENLGDVGILTEVEVDAGGTIWIAGECGRVWLSTDEGANWNPIKSQTSAHVRGMSFPAADTGFLAGHRTGRTGSAIVRVTP